MQFAAYGTLRKGSYNYDRFKYLYEGNFEYVKTIAAEVPYTMFDLGAYPALYPVRRQEIVFDIIECSDEAYRMVTRMETGSGYTTGTVTHEETKYPIFIYNHGTLDNHYQEVNDGDWIKREDRRKEKV